MSLVLRPASLGDVPAICAINRASLGYDCPAGPTGQWVAALLARQDHCLLVVQEGEAVLGYAHAFHHLCAYAAPKVCLQSLAVLPQAQGKGLGRALLSAIEDWGCAQGIAQLTLESGMDRTGAHAFYLAQGYTLRKDHRNFVKDLT